MSLCNFIWIRADSPCTWRLLKTTAHVGCLSFFSKWPESDSQEGKPCTKLAGCRFLSYPKACVKKDANKISRCGYGSKLSTPKMDGCPAKHDHFCKSFGTIILSQTHVAFRTTHAHESSRIEGAAAFSLRRHDLESICGSKCNRSQTFSACSTFFEKVRKMAKLYIASRKTQNCDNIGDRDSTWGRKIGKAANMSAQQGCSIPKASASAAGGCRKATRLNVSV